MSEKLTDDDVYERLHAALLALGREKAETKLGHTTITTARLAVASLQQNLLQAMESGSSVNSAILDPSRLPEP